MEPHANGEVVNLEHFFSVLSLKMFCRYAIDYEFPDSGEGALPSRDRRRATRRWLHKCMDRLGLPPVLPCFAPLLPCLQTCGAS